MVAGFVTVNYTQGGRAFHEAVDALSGPIYLLFFVFTGATMDLSVLVRNLPASLLIFSTRAVRCPPAALTLHPACTRGTHQYQPIPPCSRALRRVAPRRSCRHPVRRCKVRPDAVAC